MYVCCSRTYNIQAISFTPRELVEEMKKYFPDMKVTYKPDQRQAIGEDAYKIINPQRMRKGYGTQSCLCLCLKRSGMQMKCFKFDVNDV